MTGRGGVYLLVGGEEDVQQKKETRPYKQNQVGHTTYVDPLSCYSTLFFLQVLDVKRIKQTKVRYKKKTMLNTSKQQSNTTKSHAYEQIAIK